VIYVMGAGRSGSTVLGVALGNCRDVFYAGELEAWLRRSGEPNFDGAERAQFWQRVRDAVGGADLYGDRAWRYIEYSLAPLRPRGWRGRAHLRRRYEEVCGDLYGAIAATAQVSHVVDSSHYPLRARALQRIDGIEVYLVYLVREPVSVVASFRRRDVTNRPKSLLAANAYLSLTHLLSVCVFLGFRSDRRMLLRYEDFMTEPEATLGRLLEWAGVSGPLPDLAALKTGTAFQGNRLLDSDVIALRAAGASRQPRSLNAYLTRLLQSPATFAQRVLGR
jgi:hypothetical protein